MILDNFRNEYFVFALDIIFKSRVDPSWNLDKKPNSSNFA